jgi:hypothetical protein
MQGHERFKFQIVLFSFAVSLRQTCMTCLGKNVTIGYLSTQKRITDGAER